MGELREFVVKGWKLSFLIFPSCKEECKCHALTGNLQITEISPNIWPSLIYLFVLNIHMFYMEKLSGNILQNNLIDISMNIVCFLCDTLSSR